MNQLEIDLPASCLKDLRKQEGQEGGGGVDRPPSRRPIHRPDRKVQEGRRKQEGGAQEFQLWRAKKMDEQAEQEGKVGRREWRDGEGRDHRQWWEYMRQVLRIAREMKGAREMAR